MLKQVEPGPFEIRLRDSTSENRVGYAWYEGGSGTEKGYFVLESGTPFPLPYGPDVIFSPHAMPDVHDADEFYQWVEEHGELGSDTTSWVVDETYGPWK